VVVSVLSLLTLKQGTKFTEMHTTDKEEAIVLAVSAWDAMMSVPTKMP
jgi:hypothetical protein